MIQRPSRKTFRSRLEDMVSSLRSHIISGILEPEQFLPSEKQLAEQYGLSVQSVRKGLDVLVGESLILKIPKIGSKVVAPAEKGAITLRLGYLPSLPEDADIHELIAMFRKEYPNIHVQAVPIVGFTYDQIKPYLDNGMLDVVTLNYDNFQQFSENGKLDDFECLDRCEELYPFLTDAFIHEGQLRIQPFAFSPLVICYNREHFQQQGLPEPNSSWNWQRLIDCAARLDIPNERIGFQCYFSSHYRASILLMQMGKSFERYTDGRLKLTGTPMMEAIRYGREIYSKSPQLPSSLMDWGDHKLEMFRQGKISMLLQSYFKLNPLRHTELDYDIAPVPHFGEPITVLLILGMAISRHTRHKAAAKKLVDFMISEKAQLRMRQKSCSLPARISAAEWSGPDSESINRPSRFSLFREIIPSYRFMTDMNITESEYRMLFNELRMYWAGLENEETFCRNIEAISPSLPLPS